MRSGRITRREILELALASPLLTVAAVSGPLGDDRPKGLNQQSFLNASSRIVPAGEPSETRQLRLSREWRGPLCRSRLMNRGPKSVRVKEVVLFDLALPLPPETALYGEGFQMLSQTGGTLGRPVDLGNYTDAKHYKMPLPADARSAYGMMSLSLPLGGGHHLLAFTSCRRFIGQFYLRGSSLQVVIDTESLEIRPGESWDLEEFTFRSGASREQLLTVLAQRLIENHPPLRLKTPPAGWCSWYCFGPTVTARQVLDNLDFIAIHSPWSEIHTNR